MRRTAIAFVSLALASLIAAGTAAGGASQFKRIPIDATFLSGFLTNACGIEVSLVITGTLSITVVTDGDGVVIREVDTQPGSRFGFASPQTGRSFDFPNSLSAHYEYPNGTSLGAVALVKLTGLIARAPGLPAEAGQTAGEGEIVFVTPEGIPVVDFSTVLVEHGNRADGVIEAVCSALGA